MIEQRYEYAAPNGRSSTVANAVGCGETNHVGADALVRPSTKHAYPAAINGTATNVATMPTVFQRVKRSPKKRRASKTVSAG